jgi:lipopolysaccharide transport system permease protein
MVPAIALLYVFLIGVALGLAALGVYLRDLKDVIQLYTLVGLYLAPIFYTAEAIPGELRLLIYLNPITPFVMCFHEAAYYQMAGGPGPWLVSGAFAAGTLFIGAWLFDRLKPYFGTFL